MRVMLKVSRWIDTLNEKVGRAAMWLLLLAVLISALNAVVRKAFNYSSNGFLEIQWYLFSGAFLLGAAYTLLHNGHVRIDVLAGRFSKQTQAWIEIFGTLFFLLPFCALVLWTGTPWFVNAFVSQEFSGNAGGLILWPVKLLLPLGFALLSLQGVSELIKRVAFLRGLIADPVAASENCTPEEALIVAVKKSRGDA